MNIMDVINHIINRAEKGFDVSFAKDVEEELGTLDRWKNKDLKLDFENYKNCFQSPVLYFEEGVKKLPSKGGFEKKLHDKFLATYALAGFGNGYSRSIKAKDHFLLFFALLESPLGEVDYDSFGYNRDYIVTGAITACKVEKGILWGFWPDDDLFSDYNAYIKKICTILDCSVYTKEDLKKGRFKLVHEEPDCNWKKPPFIP